MVILGVNLGVILGEIYVMLMTEMIMEVILMRIVAGEGLGGTVGPQTGSGRTQW